MRVQMILSGLFSPFKKIKEDWRKKQDANLFKDYESHFKELQDDFDKKEGLIISEIEEKEDDLIKKQRDLEDLIKRVEDKKLDLEKKNEELREQIRLIEAKASPDSVWINSFSMGFSKAWDFMLPMFQETVIKSQKHIRDTAINETLDGLEEVLKKRIEDLNNVHIKTVFEVIEKKKNLEKRINETSNEMDKLKLSHYLEALNWSFNDYTKNK